MGREREGAAATVPFLAGLKTQYRQVYVKEFGVW